MYSLEWSGRAEEFPKSELFLVYHANKTNKLKMNILEEILVGKYTICQKNMETAANVCLFLSFNPMFFCVCKK